MNERFIYDYDREAVRIKTENSIRKEAMELGELRGERKEKHNIVKAMLKKNMKINLISELTGLSAKEINKLAH